MLDGHFGLPFLERLSGAERILLAGAGGGFDIYSGLPLYFALRAAGKTVHLANLSFSQIYASNGKRIGRATVRVDAKTIANLRYFPEWYLAKYLDSIGQPAPVFAFDRVGPGALLDGYRELIEHLGGVDAVVLIDGGTDSLMRGDEPGLGTPEEDLASLRVVDTLAEIPIRLLACLGFGVDTFHGVCHHYFLEATAALTKSGHFLGAWSVMGDRPEAQKFRAAVKHAENIQFNHPSIVCSSIVSALDGHFDNHHANFRTESSTLYINPLMTMYFTFDAVGVADRHLFVRDLPPTDSYVRHAANIGIARQKVAPEPRPWRDIPM